MLSDITIALHEVVLVALHNSSERHHQKGIDFQYDSVMELEEY